MRLSYTCCRFAQCYTLISTVMHCHVLGLVVTKKTITVACQQIYLQPLEITIFTPQHEMIFHQKANPKAPFSVQRPAHVDLICASRLMLKQRPRKPVSARKKHCRKGCNHSNVQGGRRMRRMSIKASSKLWSCWCNTQGAFRIKYNIWIRFERLPVIISKRLWIGFTRQSFMHSGWKSTPMLFSGRSLSQMYTLL